ncbi:MAG: polysaccharide deacetylase family protein [Bryobacterales bacterium]|nr:polysaccharide deacetylase family protein [Bryobacterales bacterium]
MTTSWDDGHALDMKLAAMLARHGVPGTFYVPRQCEGRALLGRDELQQLAQGFELGAHTLHHPRLTTLPDREADSEIRGSRQYVEDITGRECRVFAPPGGRFKQAHVRMAAEAGFRGFRTTELLDYGMPRWRGGIAVLPTTLQAHVHPAAGYWRNAIRRMRLGHLLTWLRYGQGGLVGLFRSLLDRAIVQGGVVHLWGHSWEIEEHRAWPLLETMLMEINERRSQLRFVANSELCREAAR